MIQKLFLLTFLFHGLLISNPISAQKKRQTKWSVPVHLPENKNLGKQPGLAGAFTGIINNKLIIAGGANFPDSMPWQGGKKVYWNDIYILSKSRKGKFSWENTGEFKLKENIAYGASVYTRDGTVCIGGENENGISKNVFLLHGDEPGKKMATIDLPELPLPLTNLSAAAVGAVIYVAGGETANGVSNRFFKLDLHKPVQGWVELVPLPIEVSHAVMIKQLKGTVPFLYLAGGRKKNSNGISDFYSSLFEYNIEKNEWQKKSGMPYALAAATGFQFGREEIVIIGGDKGETFRKVETLLAAINAEKDEIKKQLLVAEKNKLQINHPGFSNEMLVYEIWSDKWKHEGVIPFDVPVTTTAVGWGHANCLPTGEIKAGVRTTQILMFK